MRAFKFVCVVVMILVGMSAFAERYVDYYEMDGTPVYRDFDPETWYDASKSLGYTWTGLRNLYSPVEITYRDFTFTRDIKGVERLYYKGEFQFACRDQLKDGYVLFVFPIDFLYDYDYITSMLRRIDMRAFKFVYVS